MNNCDDLERFVIAQDGVYDAVCTELRGGLKRGHWMWFIFPQLIGLGQSPTAVHFGIDNLDQARRYLSDPVLGQRLRRCVSLMLGHHGMTAFDILGSPDDLKFRSCLTLFREAAEAGSDRDLFDKALERFYDAKEDARTNQLLATTPD